MQPSIEYYEIEGIIADKNLEQIGYLAKIIDGHGNEEEPSIEQYTNNIRAGINGYRWVHLGLAYAQEQVVGYKLGRSSDPRSFESWVGGILPSHRRQGIAFELSLRQEEWCRKNKFQFMTTITAHDNTAMLILNLRHGYTIAGTFLKRGKNLNVSLEKKL